MHRHGTSRLPLGPRQTKRPAEAGRGPSPLPLLRGDGEDGDPLGAVNLLLGEGAEFVGHIDAEEAVEGEGEGEEGGHCFVWVGLLGASPRMRPPRPRSIP